MALIDLDTTTPYAILAVDESFRVRQAAGADLKAYGWPTSLLDGQDLRAAIGAEHVVVAALEGAAIQRHGLLQTDAGPLQYVIGDNGGGGHSLLLLPVPHDRRAQTNVQDPLTGVPNRIAVRDAVQSAIVACNDAGDPATARFALLFVDLDQFKIINDGLGHAVGDDVLVAIAQRLRESVRGGDVLARFGGDEFIIVMPNIIDDEEAEAVANRIHAALAPPLSVGEHHNLHVTASIGIAIGDRLSDPDILLRDADTAMYHAKSNGRGRYAWFAAPMYELVRQRLELEVELRQGLAANEFVAFYQPILDLLTQKLVGFEALVRWQHPRHGLLGPDAFMARAIETGLIEPLDRWMFRHVADQCAAWSRADVIGAGQWISVNLSEAQFSSPDLVSDAARALHESGADPERLKFEITERVFLEDADKAFATLMALRRLQVRLAIDDFGTGYSSLSYLHRFPHLVESLKIDRSFVAGIEQEVEKAEIIRAVVGLGRNLGMKIVAEGVENSRQASQLSAMRCDYGQGYYYAKPLAAADVPKFVAQTAA